MEANRGKAYWQGAKWPALLSGVIVVMWGGKSRGYSVALR